LRCACHCPLADCLANGRPPWSLAHPVWCSLFAPRSCGEGLRSPSWDEVTVSRSGGTTIECGAPSSYRDAGRDVTRGVRRHRRLSGPSQHSARRAELRGGTGGWCGDVALAACRPPAGQVGHETASARARGERAMPSLNDGDAWFCPRGHTPSTRLMSCSRARSSHRVEPTVVPFDHDRRVPDLSPRRIEGEGAEQC
jgi:hypothetical protein